MIPYLRKTKIIEYLSQHEIAYIAEMTETLGISVSTVRRDLSTLEQEGLIVQLRGGAAKLARAEPAPAAAASPAAEGSELARRAAEFVEEGDVIFLDAGADCAAILRFLGEKRVTIVTASLAVALAAGSGRSCILLGGEVSPAARTVGGSLTERMISTFYFDRAFLQAEGYLPEEGAYVCDLKAAHQKALVKSRSRHTYLLVPPGCEGRRAFCLAVTPEDCNVICEA